MEYIAIVMHAEEGGYIVRFPDIPEAFTQAETLDETREMARDVLAEAVEEYAKARKELPTPTDFATLYGAQRDYLCASGVVSSKEPIFMSVTAPSVDMTPVRVSVSFTKATLEEIDEKAHQAGYTRSGFLAAAARAYEADRQHG